MSSFSHFDSVSDPGGSGKRARQDSRTRTPFIGIQFRCCRCYGRIYRNASRTAYQGRCPRCGAAVSVPIGRGGTDVRFFSAG